MATKKYKERKKENRTEFKTLPLFWFLCSLCFFVANLSSANTKRLGPARRE
jgi:hypothetical protein